MRFATCPVLSQPLGGSLSSPRYACVQAESVLLLVGPRPQALSLTVSAPDVAQGGNCHTRGTTMGWRPRGGSPTPAEGAGPCFHPLAVGSSITPTHRNPSKASGRQVRGSLPGGQDPANSPRSTRWESGTSALHRARTKECQAKTHPGPPTCLFFQLVLVCTLLCGNKTVIIDGAFLSSESVQRIIRPEAGHGNPTLL